MSLKKLLTKSINKQQEVLSLEEYLAKAKTDPSLYATPAERMLKAIGEPTLINTMSDSRLAKIFSNRIIRVYDVFKDFYGMELTIERIVSYFRHAAQGLEESRQILYLLGPVGSAKSSLATVLMTLMEKEPIYVLTSEDGELSPVNESPLGMFSVEDSEELGIPSRYLQTIQSPWTTKRLEEYKGDMTRFKVTKIYPSRLKQIGIARTEPGDENNQDITTLVGKLDIRKLEFHAQNDPDAYNYCGGLCHANQGILEFVEMFKAPIKTLHPLLTATQEHHYNPSENISDLPFDGIVIAHSNESEWEAFKENKNNEAFLDRVCIVDVTYCLRVNEEIEIYKKLLKNSSLANNPCAPHTLKMLAEFSILTRLIDTKGSEIVCKLKAYNGENVKEYNEDAKTAQAYKEEADRAEGFTGVSTRFAYKVLSEVFNLDPTEIAADPVHLLYVLRRTVKEQKYSEEIEAAYLSMITEHLVSDYLKELGKDIQIAYLDSYSQFGQSMFDRYILLADCWLQNNDYRDPETHVIIDRKQIDLELSKIEKAASISNPKDFRHDVVGYAFRYQAKNNGNNPSWKAYDRMAKVIEANMFSKTEDLLPVISFKERGQSSENEKHDAFKQRMKEQGYTDKQVVRCVEWYMRSKGSK